MKIILTKSWRALYALYIMTKFNSMFVATAKLLTAKKDEEVRLDVNGNQSVILIPVAGSCPDKRVLSGTVALNEGMAINNTYLINCTEGEPDAEYGRQFNFSIVSTMSVMEIMQSTQMLGQPRIVETDINAEREQEEEVVVDEDEA